MCGLFFVVAGMDGGGGVFLYDHCGGVDIRICKMLDKSLNVWRLAGALCVCVCVCVLVQLSRSAPLQPVCFPMPVKSVDGL